MPYRILILATCGALAACGGAATQNASGNNVASADQSVEVIQSETGDSPANMSAAVDAQSAPTDAWIGRWNGPEGLFLDIKIEHPGAYRLTLKDNLDRQADYPATGKGEAITFTRDGKVETLRPGTGAETGFKWLADKKDCLIVETGKEGYCR